MWCCFCLFLLQYKWLLCVYCISNHQTFMMQSDRRAVKYRQNEVRQTTVSVARLNMMPARPLMKFKPASQTFKAVVHKLILSPFAQHRVVPNSVWFPFFHGTQSEMRNIQAALFSSMKACYDQGLSRSKKHNKSGPYHTCSFLKETSRKILTFAVTVQFSIYVC